MRFSAVYGECDPKLVADSQEKLSTVFLELAASYSFGAVTSITKLGGDPFIYQMVATLPHICDARSLEFDTKAKILEEQLKKEEISEEEYINGIKELKGRLGNRLLSTAATNGSKYYWAPQFVVAKSRTGLRFVVCHEGFHTIYMHPSRRGSRLPLLWNISVDYKVNYNIINDLIIRKVTSPIEMFKKELGDYIELEEYAQFLKDPFNPPEKLADWNPINHIKQDLQPGYKEAGKKEDKTLFYASATLSDDLRHPEYIYSYLYKQIPTCKGCGRLGVYKKPEEYKVLEKQLMEMKQDANKSKNANEHKHDGCSADCSPQQLKP